MVGISSKRDDNHTNNAAGSELNEMVVSPGRGDKFGADFLDGVADASNNVGVVTNLELQHLADYRGRVEVSDTGNLAGARTDVEDMSTELGEFGDDEIALVVVVVNFLVSVVEIEGVERARTDGVDGKYDCSGIL